MADTVSFKVFLTKEDEPEAKPEVRRFGIDKDVVTNFLYFNEKLQTVFSGLRSRRFTISWRDADDDDVVISSDEELKIALSETSDQDIRKLYISLRSDYPEAPFPSGEESPQTLHIGVTCDGCEKEVQGFRYKCIQCVDYDLCADCEAKGLHPEHCMIRSAVPMQWGSHFGRRLVHHMNRFAKKSGHCGKDKEAAPGDRECPYKRGRYHGHHGGPPHYGGHRGPRPERPSWLDAFSTYINDWTNLAGEEDCPMKENNGKNGGGEKQRSDSNPHAELFKNIGENLSSLLDPLGIDVEVRTEPQTDNSGSKTQSNPGPSTSAPRFPGEGKKLVEKNPPAEKAEKTADRPGIGFENEGWTLLNQQDAAAAASAPSPPSNSNGAIPKPTTPPSAPADSVPASAPPTKPIYPLLPQQTEAATATPASVIYHPDPKIQRSIIAMMQMGFSNDGGWLTQLLASKNGDISKALDILQPVRPSASGKQ